MADDGSEAFSATGYDQFGHVLTAQPDLQWSVPAGEGSVDASGVYSAPGTAFSGTVTVTASQRFGERLGPGGRGQRGPDRRAYPPPPRRSP